MLLNAPDGKRIETINDADGFVANFDALLGRPARPTANAPVARQILEMARPEITL
jgi:hypothetical protein